MLSPQVWVEVVERVEVERAMGVVERSKNNEGGVERR
jgi:hypothetical protein